MKREIKFRCWSNDLKKMIHEYSPYNKEGLLSFSIDNHYNDKCNGESDYNLVPLQFTGLKDKNGKDIYEGDVVKAAMIHHGKPMTEFTAFIIYNEHLGSFRIAYDSIGGGSQDEIYFRHQIEVIGNIYENPELLTNN